MMAIMAVSAAVSAAASISAARQQAGAAKIARQQYEEEAANARMQADQEEVARRDELQRVLAAQDAIRAGRGVELDSPTGLAIRDTTIADVESDIGVARYNALSKARRFDLGAAIEETRGRSAMISGIGGAASSILSAASAFRGGASPGGASGGGAGTS